MKITPSGLLAVTSLETHALLGVLWVLLLALFFPFGLVVPVAGSFALQGLTFAKEYAWDPAHETDQPFFDEGLRDWVEYWVGLGAGLGLLELLHHFRGVPF